MSQSNETKVGTFWEHLDDLRGLIIRSTLAVVILGCVAFFFKDELFAIVLAPKNSDFITYRLLEKISRALMYSDAPMEVFSIKLINTQLAQQFLIHVKMSMYVGFLLAFPYILYELFLFISPALYEKERKYVFRVVSGGYILFLVGISLSYFLVFPLTFHFLGSYQVSRDVENQIVIDSYIDTMMMLNFTMGIVFEMPILSWLLGKLGLISASFLRKYRKHAIVLLLIIAAIITPTSDVFTLLVVSLPIYLLYEVSILIVACSYRKKSVV